MLRIVLFRVIISLYTSLVRILLLDEMWGPVNILRQTRNYSGRSAYAQFDANKNPFINDYDFVLVPNEKLISLAERFPQAKRIHICMENPDIWSPPYDFLSRIGTIFTPFPEAIRGLPNECRIIQSYPCVPWFYDIEFSTQSGVTHVPLNSRSELSDLMSFSMPPKQKLLSIIISSKNGGVGYAWRTELAHALKKYFGDYIDIFGFGHNPLSNKKDALDNYLATIVLENSSHPFYITEKIADALLGWSMPIYCGSTSISSLLPGYEWTLEFGSDVDSCCIQVKNYLHKMLGDISTLSSIRPHVLSRLNLFEEIPSLLR